MVTWEEEAMFLMLSRSDEFLHKQLGSVLCWAANPPLVAGKPPISVDTTTKLGQQSSAYGSVPLDELVPSLQFDCSNGRILEVHSYIVGTS